MDTFREVFQKVIQNIENNQIFNDLHVEVIKSEFSSEMFSSELVQNKDYAKRRALVKLMHNCVQIWNTHTKTNRIELAEATGYWKISVDDGRLRTRALDRYLDIKYLPKNPRWRQVVKTAHFILSECDLSSKMREYLNESLNHFYQHIR